MKHIERMEVELKELKEKIEKGKEFLKFETKSPEFTDEIQRQLLIVQLAYMASYAEALKARINYDKEKSKGGTNETTL